MITSIGAIGFENTLMAMNTSRPYYPLIDDGELIGWASYRSVLKDSISIYNKDLELVGLFKDVNPYKPSFERIEAFGSYQG